MTRTRALALSTNYSNNSDKSYNEAENTTLCGDFAATMQRYRPHPENAK